MNKNIVIRISILKQKIKENFYLIEVYPLLLLMLGFIELVFRRRPQAFKMLAQVHRTTRMNYMRLLVEPFIIRNVMITHYISDAEKNAQDRIESCLGKRIFVLKSPQDNGEKGIIYIKFSELFKLIPRVFNMEELLKDYRLVLEPSWSGYCDEDILHYTKYKDEIYILSAEQSDFEFLLRFNSNLKPLPFGPCDWVDPRLFKQYSESSDDAG
jgi:hypothetical protein